MNKGLRRRKREGRVTTKNSDTKDQSSETETSTETHRQRKNFSPLPLINPFSFYVRDLYKT